MLITEKYLNNDWCMKSTISRFVCVGKMITSALSQPKSNITFYTPIKCIMLLKHQLHTTSRLLKEGVVFLSDLLITLFCRYSLEL